MQSTKSQILTALKRQGRCSVDELALMLGLAPMTVRQHLTTLERDDLIASSEERQRLGRPHFIYSLTEKGDESFPKRYDRIAKQLILEVSRLDSSEIAGLSADEKAALLFEKLACRFVERHLPRLRLLLPAQRVAAVAEILQAEGGFAEWEHTNDGYEIRDYNCLYRRLNGDDGEPCRWHQRVLSNLLGCPVECREDAPRSVRRCRFVVPQATVEEEQRGAAASFAAGGGRLR